MNSEIRTITYPRNATGRLLVLSAAVLAIIVLSAGCGGNMEQGSSDRSSGQSGDDTQIEVTGSGSPSAEDTGTAGLESTNSNTGPVQVETIVIATGLEVPWGLVFTPDGEVLVTERDSSRLSSVDSSGNVEELQKLPESGSGEGGLLGLALSPDYERDGLIYVYYTTDEETTRGTG